MSIPRGATTSQNYRTLDARENICLLRLILPLLLTILPFPMNTIEIPGPELARHIEGWRQLFRGFMLATIREWRK